MKHSVFAKRFKKSNQGFTLIELLMVISIIALLSSVILAVVGVSKARAQDTKKVLETDAVKTAVTSYVLDHNTPPPMYDCTTSCTPAARQYPEVEDINNPSNPATESGKAYNATMNNLVQNDYLSAVPHSPDASPYEYFYYPPGTLTPQGGTVTFGVPLSSPTSPSLSNPNNCKLQYPCPVDYVPDWATHNPTQCVQQNWPQPWPTNFWYGSPAYSTCVSY